MNIFSHSVLLSHMYKVDKYFDKERLSKIIFSLILFYSVKYIRQKNIAIKKEWVR
jgi:hypothetical protein